MVMPSTAIKEIPIWPWYRYQQPKPTAAGKILGMTLIRAYLKDLKAKTMVNEIKIKAPSALVMEVEMASAATRVKITQ